MISSKKSRIGAVALSIPMLTMAVGPVFAADAVAQSAPATVQTTQVAQLGSDQPVPLQEAEMGETKGKWWFVWKPSSDGYNTKPISLPKWHFKWW